MKRLFVFLVAFGLPLTASAVARRYFHETQITTRAAPSGTPGSDSNGLIGMGLSNVIGYQVSVCAVQDGGTAQNLGGTGYLRAYLYHDVAAKWMRNNDLDLAVDVTGTDCQAFPQPDVPAGIDGQRVLYAADSVTVVYPDGGAVGGTPTLRVRIDGKLKSE